MAHDKSDDLFATAEERKYPVLLCQRMAKLVREHCLPQSLQAISGCTATGKQPRRGLNEVVP
eukprot:3880191-Karenia_brevis.AAC.1